MIAIKISLKFVPKGTVNNIPALVQLMASCRPINKPLSEPMMVEFIYAYMGQAILLGAWLWVIDSFHIYRIFLNLIRDY